MKTISMTAALLLALCSFSTGARADELIEEYNAYIGQDDLYNSKNERLTKPWQIIRQDRANYHRFGVSQRGDEDDAFFSSAKNRDRAERMIANGSIERRAARMLYEGDCLVNVQIFRGDDGDFVNVTVE